MKTLLDMLEIALGVGIAFGVGYGFTQLIDAARQRLWPEPPAKPPARYTVQVTDEDGWPLRTYRLTANDIGPLLAGLDRTPPP